MKFRSQQRSAIAEPFSRLIFRNNSLYHRKPPVNLHTPKPPHRKVLTSGYPTPVPRSPGQIRSRNTHSHFKRCVCAVLTFGFRCSAGAALRSRSPNLVSTKIRTQTPFHNTFEFKVDRFWRNFDEITNI
ncbi:hypothetical protein TcasGA2_TC015143 [Tribolium castaneum]|uniref:Uncharacterized protein n=1 Tax=Tribolium castaneum TaxID=7070 RepID=D2A5M9_TRICA|nr:hypothetical protein TcasGA2_TC015143 [Tribolium castaneum]